MLLYSARIMHFIAIKFSSEIKTKNVTLIHQRFHNFNKKYIVFNAVRDGLSVIILVCRISTKWQIYIDIVLN